MKLDVFSDLVRSSVALRLRLTLQPAGGDGSKVAPPTYSGPVYATESRMMEGKPLPCVLLDSFSSQANRMEQALLKAWRQKEIEIPIVYSDFHPYFGTDGSGGVCLLRPVGWITALDAPHRISDAILRDSLVPEEGLVFRTSRIEHESSWGQRLRQAGIRQARVLYEICPTALLFGMWDATLGPMGLRIERAITSEVVGMDVVFGTRTSSRIDPLAVERDALPVYRSVASHPLPWTVVPEQAQKNPEGKPILYGKEGHPSEINHGNILPTAERGGENAGIGGITMRAARMTTVLSLTALRRFSFPATTDAPASPTADLAGQTVLAALGVTAVSLMLRDGLDLRSRCVLCPVGDVMWEAISPWGEVMPLSDLRPEKTPELLKEAVRAASAEGLAWRNSPLRLVPTEDLIRLVAASQRLAPAGAANAASVGDDAGAETGGRKKKGGAAVTVRGKKPSGEDAGSDVTGRGE